LVEFIGVILSACSKQQEKLNMPNHADLRYKCRTYARLL